MLSLTRTSIAHRQYAVRLAMRDVEELVLLFHGSRSFLCGCMWRKLTLITFI